MNNLKLPAAPFFDATEFGNAVVLYAADGSKQILPFSPGFAKLEKASLMIAQGMTTNPIYSSYTAEQLAKKSTHFARAILEEANKPQEESAVVKMLRAVTERLEWTTLYASFADDEQETEILLKAAKAILESK